mmetsp:Transcript_3012/g.8042  ORF Transcript_3012/g.8042 Transcript_3012/m.8042 type:complete len:245 (+) Transcript_3012:797-1531(+)
MKNTRWRLTPPCADQAILDKMHGFQPMCSNCLEKLDASVLHGLLVETLCNDPKKSAGHAVLDHLLVADDALLQHVLEQLGRHGRMTLPSTCSQYFREVRRIENEAFFLCVVDGLDVGVDLLETEAPCMRGSAEIVRGAVLNKMLCQRLPFLLLGTSTFGSRSLRPVRPSIFWSLRAAGIAGPLLRVGKTHDEEENQQQHDEELLLRRSHRLVSQDGKRGLADGKSGDDETQDVEHGLVAGTQRA